MSRSQITPIWLEPDLETVWNGARDIFEQARGKSIFLTGGTGFLGRWLTESLLWARREAGIDITVHLLTRNPERFLMMAPHLRSDPGLVLHTGDVRTIHAPNALSSILEKTSIDWFIHGAAETANYFDPIGASHALDTADLGTRNILALAQACGAGRFLYLSSGAVYGPQPADLRYMSETYIGAFDHRDPAMAYAHGKRIGELLCTLSARDGGLQTVIARCFAFTGAFLPLESHFAIGNFIASGLQKGRIEIQGDGTPIRSYLYGTDWSIWALRLLANAQSGSVYNIGSDEEINIRDLAELVATTIAEIHGKRPEIIVHKKPQPGILPSRYVPDVTQAKRDFGLGIMSDIHSSVRKTVSWVDAMSALK